MPSEPEDSDIGRRLAEILDNIDFAKATIAGMTPEDFENDRTAFYTVTRCLEIISEASRHLPADILQRYPDVPWPAIAAAGNVYRHEYWAVRRSRIWNTARVELALLEAAAPAELDALGGATG